ncbi:MULTISPECIES: aldehyde dehydrogenase family protein [unclassified Sphingomonas]|uniref:aldehyde dehydrogenase family protein n=1 Tax=unclassified Sphingomonas TaxID=196159 RepID=UPI0006F200D5|nr:MULTISPECIES: aldehyde dehydrogenase family protein [unclassified Sphingomonas]KQX18600.1 aldehyde dehydrogenase [Sphingomonas sp. Root1294]KQY72077.1 aldehyde dehydrogenase [Sphingomonas sp. Root50]KRB94654.1 aldehyde dehydrogenase [Sphingomonas sp. Root720]
MRHYLRFYIDGGWVDPMSSGTLDVINPATEQVNGTIALATSEDVDAAVTAACRAFPAWSDSTREDRLAVLKRVLACYDERAEDLAAAVTQEMGAPTALAKKAQVPIGRVHIASAIDILASYEFSERRGATLIDKMPIGVCGFITPWNWPLNQITCKVAPALATGCTMVLKPSEVAPFSAQIFAEIMDAAGVPPGVFNMIQGDGPAAGAALSSHVCVDMISFTGSTRAGIEVAHNAAPTVKRVHQELGGKSPNIVLDDDQLARNVGRGVAHIMVNSGQSCNAPTRMLVPAARMAEAADAAREAVASITVGDPSSARMGPVVSEIQWQKIQKLIQAGIAEGAELVAGGLGKPDGQSIGYYVKPTIFASVDNGMTIAQEEIFGPVLTIIGYDAIDDAIRIANDTPYGLAAYVNGSDHETARAIAARLRAGQVAINGAQDPTAPFGGFKMSGNGREWGERAFDEFLETKAVLGFEPAPARA